MGQLARLGSKYAVMSCVHGNLEALEAVLNDMEREGVHDLVSLGDMVGYGPNPAECADLILERGSINLLGNHEQALIHGAYAF